MIHKPGPILFQNLHSSRAGEWFGQLFMNIGIDGDEDQFDCHLLINHLTTSHYHLSKRSWKLVYHYILSISSIYEESIDDGKSESVEQKLLTKENIGWQPI